MFSVLDMFSVGVGPSSSHTVGPMLAAQRFSKALADGHLLARVTRVHVTLYGSLALTGLGHGTDRAAVVGLENNEPKTVDTDYLARIHEICDERGTLNLNGEHEIAFEYGRDIEFDTGDVSPRIRMACGSRHMASTVSNCSNRCGIRSAVDSSNVVWPRIRLCRFTSEVPQPCSVIPRSR